MSRIDHSNKYLYRKIEGVSFSAWTPNVGRPFVLSFHWFVITALYTSKRRNTSVICVIRALPRDSTCWNIKIPIRNSLSQLLRSRHKIVLQETDCSTIEQEAQIGRDRIKIGALHCPNLSKSRHQCQSICS